MSLEELQGGVFGDKFKTVTRKRVKKKKKKEKPVGFYKEGGKTKPITKAKGTKKKTRVVTRHVPAPGGVVDLSNDLDVYRDQRGFHMDTPSKSSSATHTTTYWEINHKQFSPGDITCSCKGWIFSKGPIKTCRHCDTMRAKVAAAQAAAPVPVAPRSTPAPASSSRMVENASWSTQSKFEKVTGGISPGVIAGFVLNSGKGRGADENTVGLVVDRSAAIQGASDEFARFIQNDLGASRSQMRTPDASYSRITLKALGESIQGAADPKDQPYLYIGDTTYGKYEVKIALRTLGGKNIRIFSMGKDEPVFMVNAANEAVVIAPTSGPDDDFLRLKDIAS